MCEVPAAASGKVVVGAARSDRFEKRYVVVDGARGEVVDGARGYGYTSAQNAHRAHAHEWMPPRKTRQRDAVKRPVQRWCAEHADFMQHVEQAMVYAMKDGEAVTEADVVVIMAEHGVQLPLTADEMLRHW